MLLTRRYRAKHVAISYIVFYRTFWWVLADSANICQMRSSIDALVRGTKHIYCITQGDRCRGSFGVRHLRLSDWTTLISVASW